MTPACGPCGFRIGDPHRRGPVIGCRTRAAHDHQIAFDDIDRYGRPETNE